MFLRLDRQSTDLQSGLLSIIPNELAVSERHSKIFITLHASLVLAEFS